MDAADYKIIREHPPNVARYRFIMRPTSRVELQLNWNCLHRAACTPQGRRHRWASQMPSVLLGMHTGGYDSQPANALEQDFGLSPSC